MSFFIGGEATHFDLSSQCSVPTVATKLLSSCCSNQYGNSMIGEPRARLTRRVHDLCKAWYIQQVCFRAVLDWQVLRARLDSCSPFALQTMFASTGPTFRMVDVLSSISAMGNLSKFMSALVGHTNIGDADSCTFAVKCSEENIRTSYDTSMKDDSYVQGEVTNVEPGKTNGMLCRRFWMISNTLCKRANWRKMKGLDGRWCLFSHSFGCWWCCWPYD